MRKAIRDLLSTISLLDVCRLLYRLLRVTAVVALGVGTFFQLVGETPADADEFKRLAGEHWLLLVAVLLPSLIAAVSTERLFGRPALLFKSEWANALEIGLHGYRQAVGRMNKVDRRHSEEILRSAQGVVQTALELNDDDLIQLNLMVIAESPAQDDEEPGLLCIARSKPGKVSKPWAWNDETAACQAIAKNATIVQPRTDRIAAFKDKPYRCVLATPIAVGELAYGAITVDSKNPTLLKGMEERIGRILRVYAAIFAIALREQNNGGCRQCPARDLR